MEIDLTQGITKQATHRLIDEATFTCYAYNRKRRPDIAPKEWVIVFPNALEMEQRLISQNN